jgi:toxin ParE1/3/4
VTVEFHPAAREEFLAAASYYNAAVLGLGSRFVTAVQQAITVFVAHPDIGRPAAAARRVTVAGFPYDVVYRVGGDAAQVLAIAHQHRRPGYWRGRIPG